MRRRLRDRQEAGIDMTPMLDIVFIMLIFFIVTTSFVRESGIDVSRPTAESAQTQPQGNILIGISASGEIWIDRRAVDLHAVRANIQRLHALNPESAVVIQADSDASTGALVAVMDQVRLAGIENVSIAAEQ